MTESMKNFLAKISGDKALAEKACKLEKDELIALGELGLSGELRAISGLENRVREAMRLGFTRAVVPARNLEKRKLDLPIELIPVKSIYEALRVLRKIDAPEQIDATE